MRAHLVEPRGTRQRLPGGTTDQHLSGGTRIRDAAERDALAAFANRAVKQCGLGVDDDPAAGGIDRRRLAELQREVERLAEQDDQIGAPDCIGERTECRVIEAARAFHDGGRDPRRGFDPRQQIATGTIGQCGTGEQERSLRGRDDIQDGVGHRFAKRDRRRSECACLWPGKGVARDSRVQQIGRQAEMHRTGPAGTRDPDRLGDILAECLRGRRGPRCLRHWRCHLGLAQFLEAAATQLRGFGVTRQQYQR